MQNFMDTIPPLEFLVWALLISVSIWLIQSWIRCFAHSNFHPPISNPDFSADERRVIIDFVHYGLTVDQIRSYVENEKHFTLEGLQYGLYKMLFTKEK